MHQEKRAATFVYLLVLVVCAAWTGGAVLAPVLESKAAAASAISGGHISTFHLSIVPIILRGVYHFVCHQIPARSLWIDNRPMAVCARCFGIYLGCLAGLAAYPFSRRIDRRDNPDRMWLILALIPAAVDFFGGWAGLFQNTASSRMLTGIIAGAAGVFYIMPGLVSVGVTVFGFIRRLTAALRKSSVSLHGLVSLCRGPGGEQFNG